MRLCVSSHAPFCIAPDSTEECGTTHVVTSVVWTAISDSSCWNVSAGMQYPSVQERYSPVTGFELLLHCRDDYLYRVNRTNSMPSHVARRAESWRAKAQHVKQTSMIFHG